MKKALMTILREASTPRSEFRRAAGKLAYLLAVETGSVLKRETFRIRTPLAETDGERLVSKLVLVPILRSGLALLPEFMEIFSEAEVGFLGMRRDEATKRPELYYEHLPEMGPGHEVIVIDPMLATGGSGVLAIDRLESHGVTDDRLVYVSMIAAPEGVAAIRARAPRARLVIGQHDARLNGDAFIVPGIGDFGDRFFAG